MKPSISMFDAATSTSTFGAAAVIPWLEVSLLSKVEELYIWALTFLLGRFSILEEQ